jgi:transposase
MSLEPELAQIALLKLEGQSNDEIAKSFGVCARTIADSLKEIAERWSEA